MSLFDKLNNILYDATIGLAKQYQEKALQLVKIEAAAMYVRGVKELRRHTLMVCTMLFCAFTVAFAVVIVPLAIVLALPIHGWWKCALVVLVGAIELLIPIVVLSRFFSEKKWLEVSRSQEILDSVTQQN